MRTFAKIAFLSTTILSGCTAGTSFFGSTNTLFIGTRDADSSANGLPFALAGSVVEDLEGAGQIKVKVVRALTDWDSGTTRLLISDETLTLVSGDIASGLDNITLTLGGETVQLVGGGAPVSSGQADDWSAYLNTIGEVSGTGAVYTYQRVEDPALKREFDTEAFFAFGYETDPDEIADLVGTAIYSGPFGGFGQVLDPLTGAVVETEQEVSGTITLTADFDASTPSVTGDLAGTFEYRNIDFTTSFTAPVEGNGFLGELDSMTCNDAVCLSNSEVAGAFFGADAQESSGLIGMNVRVIPDVGTEYRFISGGGYTATRP